MIRYGYGGLGEGAGVVVGGKLCDMTRHGQVAPKMILHDFAVVSRRQPPRVGVAFRFEVISGLRGVEGGWGERKCSESGFGGFSVLLCKVCP